MRATEKESEILVSNGFTEDTDHNIKDRWVKHQGMWFATILNTGAGWRVTANKKGTWVVLEATLRSLENAITWVNICIN